LSLIIKKYNFSHSTFSPQFYVIIDALNIKEIKMFNFIKKIILALTLLLFSCEYIMARPPKPGPNFIWVKKYTTPLGITIPAHWKYRGKKKHKRRIHKRKRKIYPPKGFRGKHK
jgi:hypothetical protein